MKRRRGGPFVSWPDAIGLAIESVESTEPRAE